MNKKEINPRLKKELEQLQEVPERGLQASHAAGEKYLAQVRTMKPRPVQAIKAGRKAEGVRRGSWVSRFASHCGSIFGRLIQYWRDRLCRAGQRPGRSALWSKNLDRRHPGWIGK